MAITSKQAWRLRIREERRLHNEAWERYQRRVRAQRWAVLACVAAVGVLVLTIL